MTTVSLPENNQNYEYNILTQINIMFKIVVSDENQNNKGIKKIRIYLYNKFTSQWNVQLHLRVLIYINSLFIFIYMPVSLAHYLPSL